MIMKAATLLLDAISEGVLIIPCMVRVMVEFNPDWNGPGDFLYECPSGTIRPMLELINPTYKLIDPASWPSPHEFYDLDDL